MDIRKMIDVTKPSVIDYHIVLEREHQNYLLRRGRRYLTRAEQKALRRSQQRTQNLEQAYMDWAYSDNLRDLKYGGE